MKKWDKDKYVNLRRFYCGSTIIITSNQKDMTHLDIMDALTETKNDVNKEHMYTKVKSKPYNADTLESTKKV